MLNNRCQIVVEQEGTPGTAETLLAADVILASNPSFEPIIEPYEREAKSSSLSVFSSVFGQRSAKMSFDVDLVGAAAAGDSVHYSDALLACGFAETLVAVTSATYLPASDSLPSVTLGMYVDGKIYKMWGAVGTVSLLLEAGKPGVLHFEFTGADFSVTDGAFLAAVTYEPTIPPTFQGATLTIDGFAAKVSKVEINMNNVVALRPDANASSGNGLAVITGRRPTMSIDPLNELVATEDFEGNWRAGTLMAFSAVLGSVAGNTITITAPKVQYHDVKPGDRDGESILEIESLLCRNSGDDEIQIQNT